MLTRPNIVMLTLDEATPDRRTALADLRAALCLHTGVDIDDIDPASGHDMSLRSYLSVRSQWERHIREWGLDEYMRAGQQRTLAAWGRRRPQYLTAYPWPEESR